MSNNTIFARKNCLPSFLELCASTLNLHTLTTVALKGSSFYSKPPKQEKNYNVIFLTMRLVLWSMGIFYAAKKNQGKHICHQTNDKIDIFIRQQKNNKNNMNRK